MRYPKPLALAITFALVLQLFPAQAWAEVMEEANAAQPIPEEQAAEAAVDEAAPQQEEASQQEETPQPEVVPQEQASEPQEQASEPQEQESEDDQPTIEAVDPADEPAPAKTEPTDGVEEQDVEPADDDPLKAQDASEDPFYFLDVQTNQRVTTLHTSGTYQLVTASGEAYANSHALYFRYMGDDPRGGSGSYTVYTEEVDVDGDYNYEAVYLDGLWRNYSDYWPVPSGSYRISFGSYNTTELSQHYRVVNDGLFRAEFDFSRNSENNETFSVKPYTEGKSDDDYDSGEWVWDDNTGENTYVYSVPDQDPFALASDTRLKFWVNTSCTMTQEDSQPQLESIGLWKADETLEQLTTNYIGKYGDYISDIEGIRAEGGFAEIPSWPNRVNFATDYDDKTTVLWQRGDSELSERFGGNEFEIQNGTEITSGYFIIDRANFASVVAEDGLYFPVVRMTFKGETYTTAYYPIQVSAEATSPRNDPRITTTSLTRARVGDAYSVTLKGKSKQVSSPGL